MWQVIAAILMFAMLVLFGQNSQACAEQLGYATDAQSYEMILASPVCQFSLP